MLAKSKLNSIESLISQALNDLDISHEEFTTILDEKNKYDRMKFNLINENENKKEKSCNIKQKIRSYKKTFFFLLYTKMLEITRKNCYKCDLETIINNDRQYFWINLRDFEAETESNWLNIFNKQGKFFNSKIQERIDTKY